MRVLAVCRVGCAAWWLGVASAQSTRPIVFDTVSIKPFQRTGLPDSYGADPRHTPDGYKSDAQPMWGLIMLAYYESARTPFGWERFMLQGAPAWVVKNEYDIRAKVAPEDVAVWQQPDPGNERLRGALQTMLQERCRIALHRITTEQQVYALVVNDPAKLQRKLKKSTAPADLPKDAVHPPNDGYWRTLGNGPATQFYGMSMRYVAAYMETFGLGHLIVDETGLPGGYDFVLPALPRDPEEKQDIHAFPWNLDSLGLALKPVKAPVETLVIDHIEEPTPD